jgi:hypothetical protein
MSEWVARVPNELEVDAVGLWQIIPTGRDSFNLSGKELEDFARRCIIALIERGAVPVLPAEAENEFWKEQKQYGNSASEIADSIVKEWEQSGRDPDHDGIWFSIHPD